MKIQPADVKFKYLDGWADRYIHKRSSILSFSLCTSCKNRVTYTYGYSTCMKNMTHTHTHTRMIVQTCKMHGRNSKVIYSYIILNVRLRYIRVDNIKMGYRQSYPRAPAQPRGGDLSLQCKILRIVNHGFRLDVLWVWRSSYLWPNTYGQNVEFVPSTSRLSCEEKKPNVRIWEWKGVLREKGPLGSRAAERTLNQS
jgi:hypothetical protein